MYINELPTQLTVDNAIIQLGDTDASQKGRQFKARFIQAGIAGYPKQFGNVLITKETLNRFVFTLIGKPVIINHKENISDDDIVGEVTNVWFNEEDGWFWCEGYLTDETAINLVKDKKWSVSCSYDVLLLDDEGGTENNVKYDQEFLNGVFTHLAIVENPRYERANIVVNSKTEIISKADNAKGFNGDEGDWITVNGVHIFVKKGQSKEEAVKDFIESKQGGAEKSETEPKQEEKNDKFPTLSREKLASLDKNAEDKIKDKDKWLDFTKEKAEILGEKVILGSSRKLKEKDFEEMDNIKIQKLKKLYKKYGLFDKAPKQETAKEQKSEGGIKETKDKQGRTILSKEGTNKKVKITKDGDTYSAYYVQGLGEINQNQEQVLDTKDFKTEAGARKWANKILADNSKEQDMTLLQELKNLIKRVQNNKGAEMEAKDRILNILNEKEVEEDVVEEVENEFDEIEKEKKEKEEVENKKKVKNEKVDKRDIIRQIMAIAGKEEASEDVKTIAKLAEKLAYDESETGAADNKKVKNEDKEEKKDEEKVKEVEKDVKKDVDNKCNNAVDYFNKVNEVYNSSCKAGVQQKYQTQEDRLEAGKKY